MKLIEGIYNSIVLDLAKNPLNFGKLENPDVSHQEANSFCGDRISFNLKITDNKVSDVKFDGEGCSICLASSSVLTEFVKGKDVESVKKITKQDVLSELQLHNLSETRLKCVQLPVSALLGGF